MSDVLGALRDLWTHTELQAQKCLYLNQRWRKRSLLILKKQPEQSSLGPLRARPFLFNPAVDTSTSCLDFQGTICTHEVTHAQPGEIHPVQGWAPSVTASPVSFLWREIQLCMASAGHRSDFGQHFNKFHFVFTTWENFANVVLGSCSCWAISKAIGGHTCHLAGDLQQWHQVQPSPELIQPLPLAAHVQFPRELTGRGCAQLEQLAASVLIYAPSWFAQLCDLLLETWGPLHHLPICQGHSAAENYLPPAGIHRRSLSWIIVLGGSHDIIKGW